MRFSVLGSGSRGNAVFVESGRTAILIDAGFSGREIERRLALVDRRLEGLAAILVTHEHNDHIAGVGVLSRRCNLPVYGNEATLRAASPRVGRLARCREFATGEPFTLGDLAIHPFAICHDTVDPVGFLIGNGRRWLACCTDTGRLTGLMTHLFRRCHGLILEANHDPDMLKNGPYPLPLQQRIRSNSGHLANADAARCVAELAGGPLQTVVLAHLSETNNRPHLVRQALESVRRPGLANTCIARPDQPLELIDLDENDSG